MIHMVIIGVHDVGGLQYRAQHTIGMAYLVWGNRKIAICQNGGVGRKIPGPLNSGDHKILGVNFAQFLTPPPFP